MSPEFISYCGDGSGPAARRQDGGSYLNYFLVRHASKKDVLFVIVGVEADDVGSLAVTEPLETLAGLGVPKLHLAIIATGQELCTVV